MPSSLSLMVPPAWRYWGGSGWGGAAMCHCACAPPPPQAAPPTLRPLAVRQVDARARAPITGFRESSPLPCCARPRRPASAHVPALPASAGLGKGGGLPAESLASGLAGWCSGQQAPYLTPPAPPSPVTGSPPARPGDPNSPAPPPTLSSSRGKSPPSLRPSRFPMKSPQVMRFPMFYREEQGGLQVLDPLSSWGAPPPDPHSRGRAGPC